MKLIFGEIMRKTKIIGTIGPVSSDYQTLKALVQAGLNVVRINLSHAKLDGMNQILENVKKVRDELKCPLPIMIDTRGPEIRVKTFKNNEVQIKKGQAFTFTARNIVGSSEIVALNEPEIIKCIKPGNKILAVNGLITFKVEEVIDTEVITKACNSGVISNHKSLSIPGLKFNTPYLNEADKRDILWAIKNDIDFIAASFVNSKEDVECLRAFLKENNGDLKIISKIESALAIKNLDEIIAASDGVMVARGDLGVEVPMSKLPELQKTIIKKTKDIGKVVITATEMLESMIYNPRPTRAEVSDVANAVYDGTSVVMLSGETAGGKYPVEAVKQMAKIAEETEHHINYQKRFNDSKHKLESTTDVISHSAVNSSFLQKAKSIVVFTDTGQSARMVSRFRPVSTILGATPVEKVYRQLELSWGVLPILTPVYNSTDEMFDIANNYVKLLKLANVDSSIIITCGTPKQPGCTNLIKIAKVN